MVPAVEDDNLTQINTQHCVGSTKFGEAEALRVEDCTKVLLMLRSIYPLPCSPFVFACVGQ